MPTEKSRSIGHRYMEEIWNKGHLATVDALFAPNFFNHNDFHRQGSDRDGFKKLVTMMRTAFPDAQFTPDVLFAEDDKVACRWTLRGTHNDDFMDVHATGRQVSLTGIDIVRIDNDQIVEMWRNEDTMSLLDQLTRRIFIPPTP